MRNSPKSVAAMVLVTLSLSTALVACGSSGAGSSSNTTAAIPQSSGSASGTAAPDVSTPYSLDVLETTPGYGNLPDLAVAYGTAEQYNLTLKTLTANGGGAANQQFAADVGDIFISGFSSALALNEAGIPTTILAATLRATQFNVVSLAGSPIKTLQDLEGKKVGITGPASFSDQALRYALVQAGLDMNDVEYISLGGVPAIMAGLEQGHVDAAMVFSPTFDQALQDGKIQVVADLSSMPFAANTILVRTADLKANPAPYCRYLAAYRAGLKQMQSDPTFATGVAKRAAGEAISDTAIQHALTDYMNKYIEFDATLTQAVYDSSKTLLVGSGYYKEDGFPTYEQLTEGIPQC